MRLVNDLVQRGEHSRGKISSGSTITCDRGSLCRVLPILTRALLLPLGIEDGGIEKPFSPKNDILSEIRGCDDSEFKLFFR